MKNILKTLFSFLFLVSFAASCATSPPPPLKYLALEKPEGKIDTSGNRSVHREFSRGGWYFVNYNFRPAADIRSYLEQVQQGANNNILKNADIELNVPFAIDIFFFGYNTGTDSLTSN